MEYRAMMTQYNDGGRAKSSRPRQKNDCMVRAIAIAFEQPYDLVYDKLSMHGRESGKGTDYYTSKRLIAPFTKQKQFPENGITLETFAMLFPKETWIIFTKKHALAIKQGVIHDMVTFGEETRPVEAAFEVISKPTNWLDAI